MDPTVPADRIAAALIVFAVLLIVLGISVYVGMMRERERVAEAKRTKDEDRAFWRELAAGVTAAIRSESALRIAAENERLYRRTVRPSE